MDKAFLKDVTVLYVEDEVEVLNLTTGILDGFVKKVIPAKNGLEGLEVFKKHNGEENSTDKIDLIVTDINMPKMNGLDMLEEIEKIDYSVSSIIITAHTDSDFLKKAINLKVRGYVTKPLNINTLMDTIAYAAEPKYLKEKLETFNAELKSIVEEKTLELRSILDFQENMILVFNETEISSANKRFLDFFGKQSIESFQEDKKIYQYFIKCDGYFSTDDKEWISEIIKLEDKERIVKIESLSKEEKIFRVDVRSFIYKTKHYVVSFNDITELQEYTDELQYKATHDNLTKLYNRQKFNDELKKEILREKRYKHNLSVIIFDIDNFKNVNDTYGHDVGDVVLKSLALIGKSSIRVTDVLARWGGEEFIVLLPETSTEETFKIAENLRVNVEKYNFEGIENTLTISLGINNFNVEKDEKDSFIKGADVALYEAKRTGKNKVVQYEE